MKKMSFEDALGELENTVEGLENNNLTLEESVKKFEKGMELSKYCNDLLEDAEKRITILIEKSNGEVTEEPFDASNEEE